MQPGLDTYRFRPPYIQDLCLVDGEGMQLAYSLTTYPLPSPNAVRDWLEQLL